MAAAAMVRRLVLARVPRARSSHAGPVGLWRPKSNGWDALWLTTTGRRTGRPRHVLAGYIEDGEDLVTTAMNGWGAGEPGWWLNLQAHPQAVVHPRWRSAGAGTSCAGDRTGASVGAVG